MEADHLEELLRRSRPEARPGLREELSTELFSAPRGFRIPRPVLVASAGVAAMAAGALALSLAGTGPLAGSDGGVEATTNCRKVTVIRRERVPYVVRSAEGRTRIAYRYEKRERQVRRCP